MKKWRVRDAESQCRWFGGYAGASPSPAWLPVFEECNAQIFDTKTQAEQAARLIATSYFSAIVIETEIE